MTPPKITDTGIRLAPDLSRVITRFFVPGREDSGPGDSRATPLVDRILSLDEDSVEETVASIEERFGSRHADQGWLVLTHGVGPMRTYAMSVILLDLDDPSRVVARSTEPLLAPTRADQNGYVPNVVYSCGAVAHNGTLVMPYGIADQTIAIAPVHIEELLGTLV